VSDLPLSSTSRCASGRRQRPRAWSIAAAEKTWSVSTITTGRVRGSVSWLDVNSRERPSPPQPRVMTITDPLTPSGPLAGAARVLVAEAVEHTRVALGVVRAHAETGDVLLEPLRVELGRPGPLGTAQSNR